MSGGAFDYKQHAIQEIADRIEREIHDATKPRPATHTLRYVSVWERKGERSAFRLSYHHLCQFTTLDEVRDCLKTLKRIKVTSDNGERIEFTEDGKRRYVYAVEYEEYEEEIDEDGFTVYSHYPDYTEETIAEFRKAVVIMKQAAIYAQRIDWLLSGDDSEESFHRRLNEELNKLNNDNHSD
jgi:hypothetical protein